MNIQNQYKMKRGIWTPEILLAGGRSRTTQLQTSATFLEKGGWLGGWSQESRRFSSGPSYLIPEPPRFFSQQDFKTAMDQ